MTVQSNKLYSFLKYLRFQDRLEAIREGRLVAPVHIRIKPINRCNHDCWYCAYRDDQLQLGSDMIESDVLPESKMFEIIDDCISMGVKAVTFSGGGEPLLYKPLPETIEKLAAGGIKVATLTNGSNLKGRVAEALAAHATWVRVSVDAWNNESYMASRGAKAGQFDALLQNMANFSGTKTKCTLGVSFIVCKENHKEITNVCRKFKDVGVSHVKLSGVVVGNSSAENNSYHNQIRNEVERQIEAARIYEDSSFSVVNHYHELEERFDKEYKTCPFLQFLTIIGADQIIYTCQDKAYTSSGVLGSIKNRSFKEFWFSDENMVKIYGLDPSVSCRHHCVSHSKNLSILEYLSLNSEHGLFV
jgi:MoaA/NifB/PqqE/SkfB family radical SAM enzyme